MKTAKAFTTIKEWSEENRPREKLLRQGPDALSNAELLTIIINTGTAQRTALDIAQDLLRLSEHNLIQLSKLGMADLQSVKGIGEKKAITLLASLELGKRRQKALAPDLDKLDSSKKVFSVLHPYFMDKTNEEFYVLYMNNAGKMVYIQLLHHGGITSVQIDTRLIFKKALELPAVTKIIVAHNHPSGDLRPSEADKLITRRIKELGSLFDIKLMDHIIVYENQYYSFADNDLL